MRRLIAGLLLGLAVLWQSSLAGAEPLGQPPAFMTRTLDPMPNDQAISRSIWAPGLDEGYVPQGLTYYQGTVILGTYKSTNPNVGRGPCRVYRVSVKDGQTLGFFDMPASCGHAGGLTMLAPGILMVADTRWLYKIDLAKALAAGNAQAGLLSSVQLTGELKGSFADFDGTDLWIGTYETTPNKGRAYRLSTHIFDADHTSSAISEADALASIPLPVRGNGMAFDASKRLWVGSSSSRFGAIYQIDPANGAELARFDAAIGLEDMGFDENGNLWTVSEAGSQRWRYWSKNYPLIFRLDPSLLK